MFPTFGEMTSELGQKVKKMRGGAWIESRLMSKMLRMDSRVFADGSGRIVLRDAQTGAITDAIAVEGGHFYPTHLSVKCLPAREATPNEQVDVAERLKMTDHTILG